MADEFFFTDEQWRAYQAIPDQGYSHRQWIEHQVNSWLAEHDRHVAEKALREAAEWGENRLIVLEAESEAYREVEAYTDRLQGKRTSADRVDFHGLSIDPGVLPFAEAAMEALAPGHIPADAAAEYFATARRLFGNDARFMRAVDQAERDFQARTDADHA